MTAQTCDYGTLDNAGRPATTIETLAQFGVPNPCHRIDFALVAFDGRDQMMQIIDGRYTDVTSYPASMTARQAYEAALAANATAVVFI